MPMIRLRCDNCERLIEVDDSYAGQKIKCPACGDVNVVPEATAPAPRAAVVRPAAPDRAAAAGYPPADGPEQVVMRVRRAMFRARPFTFLLLVLVLLAGLGAAVYFGVIANPASPGLAATGAIIGFVALVVLAGWKVATLGEALEITNKRTIERNGILSKITSEVRHNDIRNIQVTQSFRDRIFRVGQLGISSSGQDQIEIVVKDIPNPDRIRQIIDLYRSL